MELVANTPLFKTPLTDFGKIFGIITYQNQNVPLCKRLEMKYLNCMEAYGLEKGYIKCSNEFEDYYECSRHEKQMWRHNQMMAERKRQIKEGKKDKYIESPNPELLFPLNM